MPRWSPKSIDMTLVAASLLVAFFIWIIAKQDETKSATLTIPVRIVERNPLCEVVYSPKEMQISVSYPASLSTYVTNESFFVDLSVAAVDRYAGVDEFKNIPMKVSLDDVKPAPRVPANIRVNRFISSPRLTFSARLYSRDVVLDVQTTGSLAPGYELTHEPVVEGADRLRLVGPEPALQALVGDQEFAALKTEPIDLSGRSRSDDVYARVLVPQGFYLADRGREQKVLDPSEWRVLVSLPIAEERIERTIEGAPIDLRPSTPYTRFNFTPRVATVRVKGFRSLVEPLTSASFVVVAAKPVNETVGFTGEVELMPRFAESVPEETRLGVTILSVAPPTAQLTVTAAEKTEPKPFDGEAPL